jgi:hypothetical protein
MLSRRSQLGFPSLQIAHSSRSDPVRIDGIEYGQSPAFCKRALAWASAPAGRPIPDLAIPLG